MPDDSNKNQPNPATPPPSFVVDAPPPPIDQGGEPPASTENVETPPPPIVAQAGNSQTYDIPPVVTNPKPQGKGKKGMMIATILGILLLVGGVGAGVFLVQRNQNIKEKAAPDCTADCGNGQYSNFYQTPSTIGPFPQDGKVVVYYSPLGSNTSRTLVLRYNGQNYPINVSGKQRIVTTIQVASGETIDLVEVQETPPSPIPECAPDKNNFNALGWKNVNADLTCGSGLLGPPSQCPLFSKPSVSSEISWAESYGQTILSKECWADWMEWIGDYDFNDFFIQFSFEPFVPSPTPTLTPTPTSPPTVGCGSNCNTDADCISSSENTNTCYQPPFVCPTGENCITVMPPKVCRNAACEEEADCTCPTGFFSCLALKAYDTSWTLLSLSDLAKLKAGNIVRFTVAGNTNYGEITKVMFEINNVCTPEVTNKKPGPVPCDTCSAEFYYDYTIPSGVTSFTVNAKLYIANRGWMGGNLSCSPSVD